MTASRIRPSPFPALRLTTAQFIRSLILVVLVLNMDGCFLFRKTVDEVTIEELRLKYQQGKMGALLQIIEIYEDPEQPQSVRLAAAEALGESRHPTALETLARTVRDAEALDIERMLSAIDVLSRVPSPVAAEALTQALSSTDAKLNQLRTALAVGLEKIGSSDHIQTLIDIYQVSRENQIRMEQTVTRALGAMGDDRAIPILVQIASDPAVSLTTRSTALELLAKKDSPEVVKMFANMLGDPSTNLQIRDFALRAMGDIKSERLVLALLETYQMGRAEYYSLLNSLLMALDQFDDPAIKPALLEIAVGSDFPVSIRKRAIRNLANFKDPVVLDRIIPLLEDATNYYLLGAINELAEALNPGPGSREKIRRAARVAALAWVAGQS